MKISIVIPVYNSEKIINKLIEELEVALKNKKFEIMLVNDCSEDNSWKVIKKICNLNRNIKGINLKKNFGQHNAIMAGLHNISGDIIITMDDDLQHPPDSILDLIDKIINGYDLCYTKYLNRKHSLYKIILSNISNLVASLFINKDFSLYLSSFRCMNSSTKDELIKIQNPFLYIDSYLIKISKKITSINIHHQKRYLGKSNYSIKKLFLLWLYLVNQSNLKPLNFSSIIIIFLKITMFPFLIYVKFKSFSNKQFEIEEKTFN